MSHSQSFQAENISSDSEYIPEQGRGTRGSGRSRGRRRTRGRALRACSSLRVRGRGRTRSQRDVLEQEDMRRVEDMRAELVADEQARIGRLNLDQAHHVLQLCLTRDPSLIFDILKISQADPPPGRPVPGQPTWCVCQRCRDMPTLVENKCCGQNPDSCVSVLPHMDVYILQEGVLRLARRLWNDIRALEDPPDPGESNKQFRYAAYRQYVIWQYGALGQGHRVIIPSCCVWRIRDRYPDPNGHYVGFIPSRV